MLESSGRFSQRMFPVRGSIAVRKSLSGGATRTTGPELVCAIIGCG